jgi:hypothetical protein
MRARQMQAWSMARRLSRLSGARDVRAHDLADLETETVGTQVDGGQLHPFNPRR